MEKIVNTPNLNARRHSPATKEKISNSQKMRYALCRKALTENQRKKLKMLDENYLDERWIDLQATILNNFSKLLDDIFCLFQMHQQRLYGLDENKENIIKTATRQSINNFLNNESK